MTYIMKKVHKKPKGIIMDKQELVSKVAKKTNLPKTTTTKLLHLMIDLIEETVASGEKVVFANFGIFFPRVRAARNGRNPSAGKAMKIPAKRVPVFLPGKKFREDVYETKVKRKRRKRSV